ncbi:MAG: tetratricopeptide repeat protein [bacterium]|nr:tetratricopeptide repeat protein [bacterium]
MRIRKEQVVFAVSLLALGWMAKGDLEDTGPTRTRGGRRTSSQPADFRDYPAPNVSLALMDGDRDGEFRRDLFSPPRDTSPLAPLDLVLPPIESLEALRPPAAWGPGPRAMSAHLRERIEPTAEPGLFDVSDVADDGQDAAAQLPVDPDDPEARAERIAGYKRLYDSIQLGSLRFGHVRNSDRYDLSGRLDDDILFVEVDPATGLERFPGQDPVPYARERVQTFAFADNTVNWIELTLREFSDPLRPGDFEKAVLFADECVRLRNEAPRALEVALEVYTLAMKVNSDSADPRLGIARCYEVGFEFDKAFQEYKDLLENGFHTNPVVHARLADLYARFRMPKRAEELFGEGMRVSRTNWELRWRYGRFLLETGDGEAALEHLAEAERREPSTPETRAERVGIRADHGRALLYMGRMRDALAAFQRARNADPADQRGIAGVFAASLFTDGEDADLESVGEQADASFELHLSLGLQAIVQKDWVSARRFLELAVEADPFRANLPWRSLSWLAEITDYPEEAYAYIQRAYAIDPTDPWTLYQRGRLLAAQDDVEGAQGSFQDALDRELDFVDALVAMGELAQLRGLHEDAERYYERALSIDAQRPLVQSLRGFNQLELGDTSGAEESFRNALDQDPELASARNGLAWWYYANGDSEEARTQFAQLAESRRNQPEGDAHRGYAEQQIERITDHESKEVWTDRFERRPGRRIANGWIAEEGVGPEVVLRDGKVWIEGQFDSLGRTRAFLPLPAEKLLSFDVTLTVGAESRDANVGIFISRERVVRGVNAVQAEVLLYRDKEGKVRSSYRKAGADEPKDQDLFTNEWVLGQPIEVGIERIGDGSDARMNLFVDGEMVLEGLKAQSLGRSTHDLRFGVFVEAANGRRASVNMDDVRVVRRIH